MDDEVSLDPTLRKIKEKLQANPEQHSHCMDGCTTKGT